MANGRTLTDKLSIPVEPELKAWYENAAKREQVPPTIIQRRALRAYMEKETK